MRLDFGEVAKLVVAYQPIRYLRSTPMAYAGTPLGMGCGKTRFASPIDAFTLLYIAEDLATSLAEAIIRDRFERGGTRELTKGEVSGWGATEVGASSPLRLLDLRKMGCFLLGVSTDVTGAKAQDEARELSQTIYDQTDLDGLLYSSRLTKRDCAAVYDRAVTPTLTASPVQELEKLAGLVPALTSLNVKLI